MEQCKNKNFYSIKDGFERLKELENLIPFMQIQIDMYGENITAGEIKLKLMHEYCNMYDKLLTCCNDIKL